MKKKKLLFTAYNLDLGGIESALVNLLKSLDYDQNDVTLILEKQEGIFLKDIPKQVKIESYTIHQDKNVLLRKIKNRLKLWKWILKNRNGYDFAGCFTTYCIPGSILVRYASSHNAFWVHSNYYNVYHQDIDKMKKFFDERHVDQFEKIVFVSNEAQNDFIKIYPTLQERTLVINNILDYRTIQEKSLAKIKERKPRGKKLFLFVGRLEEDSKKLTRLFESMQQLRQKHDAMLWIVGDGPDRKNYQKLVKRLGIDDSVQFLGKKKNPYPYIKKADLVILTSDYEGFPVTCMEAMILGVPFLTTVGVSDAYIKLSDYGKVVNQNTQEITLMLEKFCKGEPFISRKFLPEQYITHLKEDLSKLIEGK